ncbi:choline/ethanolaminephosphotransferase 1-like isoform X1 [Dysidea avara]|uniref:choline/ethanolaminephosphotransferase 1-like isoform X1 n=1 Tax=Dysidea avara TaxID=196820 RepID=UPI00331E6BC4
MKRLTSSQLQRLVEHKYKSCGTSLLDPVLQIYWRWLVTCMPLWLAPNLITFIGLLINLIATLCVVYYDPNMVGKAPNWVFLSCALSVFIYQSLDAIDGKQARRTKTNNQLGELFDHGCDAVSNILLIPCCGGAAALNEQPNLFLALMAIQLCLFYCYHWLNYVVGELRFNWIDVTEAQWLIIIVEIVSFVCGVDVWTIVAFGKFELRQLLLIGVIVSGLLTLGRCLVTIMGGGEGKNGSSVADTSVLSPAIPLLIVLGSGLGYSYWSKFNQLHSMLYLAVFGVPIVKLGIVLVMSCITRSPMPHADITMLAPLAAISNIYFNFLVSEYLLFSLLTVFVLVDLVISSILDCREISSHLRVNVFTIPRPAE